MPREKKPDCVVCGDNIDYFDKDNRDVLTTDDGKPMCGMCNIKRSNNPADRQRPSQDQYQDDQQAKEEKKQEKSRQRARDIAGQSQQSDDVEQIHEMETHRKDKFNV